MTYTFTLNDLFFMAQGALITFVLTITSGIAGSIVGFFVGWARTSNSKIFYYLSQNIRNRSN